MPSFVWDRTPSEAYDNPYEYEAQRQFAREALACLDFLLQLYEKRNNEFGRNERSRQKAAWMLQVDGLTALADIITLLGENKFRLASRLFRDVVETVDLSVYFSLGGPKADAHLSQWFDDEIVPNRVARAFAEEALGKDRTTQARLYGELSRYTHRSYRSLKMSYILGRDDAIFYDGFRNNSGAYVTPESISFAYAISGGLIHRFVTYAILTEQISAEQVDEMWETCLEPDSEPRRFAMNRSPRHYE